MFQLDDNFLNDVGLAALPADQRKPFLQHIYQELEGRVGIRLSEGMSEQQLDEFADIIDRKDDVITTWLQTHAPDYQTQETYTKMQQVTGLPAGDPGLRAEFAATKWLEVNRPDYRDVVAKTLEELKQEIIQSKDAILGGASAAPVAETSAPEQPAPAPVEPSAPVTAEPPAQTA